MHLTLVLAQINTRLGDLQANLETHLTCIKDATSAGADLVLLPEISLTGYLLQDLVPSVAILTEKEHPVFRSLLEASNSMDFVVGFEDGLNFWGGSTVFDPVGELLVQAPYFEETLTLCELDLNQLHRKRARLPLLRDEKPELVHCELERI